jgi:hypothetical protein
MNQNKTRINARPRTRARNYAESILRRHNMQHDVLVDRVAEILEAEVPSVQHLAFSSILGAIRAAAHRLGRKVVDIDGQERILPTEVI